jgi:hypothetical protein
MRRILLLLAVTAIMLTLMSIPALAQAPQNENNCYGAGQSGNVAGKGGLPGSKHDPAPGFEDPVTGGPTWNGPVTRFVAQEPASALEDFGIPVTDELADNPNAISAFQELNRENASCGTTGQP